MNDSFRATIAFSILVLSMLFTANLAAACNGAGASCAWGTVFAIIATTFAYLAQHDYTTAASWLAHYQATSREGYAGPSNPDAFRLYEESERRGKLLQLVCIGNAVLSGLLFLFGAL